MMIKGGWDVIRLWFGNDRKHSFRVLGAAKGGEVFVLDDDVLGVYMPRVLLKGVFTSSGM